RARGLPRRLRNLHAVDRGRGAHPRPVGLRPLAGGRRRRRTRDQRPGGGVHALRLLGAAPPRAAARAAVGEAVITYVARRIVYTIPVLVVSTFLSFTFVSLAGDPTANLRANPRFSVLTLHN